MAKFDPNKAGRLCLPEGTYEAVIAKAEEKASKSSGAPMLEVHLRVYHGTAEVSVRDYLMLDPDHAMFWRFRQLVRAVDEAAWNTGDTDACVRALTDASVSVELRVESDEQYGDKNKVWKYLPLVRSASPAPARQPPNGPNAQTARAMGGKDDEMDIPF